MRISDWSSDGCSSDLRMPQYRESKWRKGSEFKRFNAWREGSMLDYLEAFAKDFPERIDEYEVLLTDNRIWKQRTVGIGVIPPATALAWRSEEHTSELQSLMCTSFAVFCFKKTYSNKIH